MNIIPAIDLLNGSCVRLLKGNYNKVSSYNTSPIEQVKTFVDAGFNYIHIIDLDAAKSGNDENLEIIKLIAQIEGLSLQIGGGIRDINKVFDLFNLGIDRLIVGTAAITDSKFLAQLKDRVDPNKLIFGLDFNLINNEPLLSVNGWTTNTTTTLFDYINENDWIKNILATDISLDGTLMGPNIDIYKRILEYKNISLIASGGIASITDIRDLIDIGSHECVVGKAIYENKITLPELQNVN
ncbi:1-(5-phosphoribosyl)-5-[(5-phosphoribosylamino)methylideneamino] imidazole-4-carboxamide isomerase [Gammaproteobacteria bacterium]|nr:1-(5-phosphoribosyl)-5-[(5-phosphoribosylamino)methylideneamino] imidazole-4-carboxamide isomerase [Gammaproteobacteria bacterium]